MRTAKYVVALALGLIALAAPRPAHADEIYAFSLSTTSVSVGSAIEPFSFSFTAPTFVVAGDTPVFNPFTVTDGTNSWTMAKDLLPAGSPGCFVFGTATDANLGVACGGVVSAPDGGLFALFLSGPLPTADGVYNVGTVNGVFNSAFATGGTNFDDVTLSGTLTVMPTPEPSSLLLLGTGLLGSAGLLRRRVRQATRV